MPNVNFWRQALGQYADKEHAGVIRLSSILSDKKVVSQIDGTINTCQEPSSLPFSI